ncbi:unnamed protein product [Ectocarpus sp. 12 AP-2014]
MRCLLVSGEREGRTCAIPVPSRKAARTAERRSSLYDPGKNVTEGTAAMESNVLQRRKRGNRPRRAVLVLWGSPHNTDQRKNESSVTGAWLPPLVGPSFLHDSWLQHCWCPQLALALSIDR